MMLPLKRSLVKNGRKHKKRLLPTQLDKLRNDKLNFRDKDERKTCRKGYQKKTKTKTQNKT